MGAVLAVILGIVAGSSEAHVNEDVGVVTGHVRVACAGVDNPCRLPLEDAPDINAYSARISLRIHKLAILSSESIARTRCRRRSTMQS